MKRFFVLIVLGLTTLACNDDISLADFNNILVVSEFTKHNEANGWYTGFSDCPADTTSYDIKFGIRNLPGTNSVDKKSLMMSGDNHSDDLFLYAFKKISGLRSNSKYEADFNISFSSMYPNNSVGIGGSPANSVYLKAGLVNKLPESEITNGEYVFNLDKSNQSQSGEEMKVMGDVAISGDQEIYKLIERELDDFKFTTNEKGEAFIVIGLDSGFEGRTTIYFEKLEIRLNIIKNDN